MFRLGHYQTRNRGTVCGSIAHADPSAELPLCLVALGGEILLRSRRTRRTLQARDFFTGMLSTARRSDEMVEVPPQSIRLRKKILKSNMR